MYSIHELNAQICIAWLAIGCLPPNSKHIRFLMAAYQERFVRHMLAHRQSMTKLTWMGEVVYVMMVCGEMAMIERCNGFTHVKYNQNQ